MKQKLFTFLTSVGILLLKEANAGSCIIKNTTVVGNLQQGTSFSDYDYLLTNEDSSFRYALQAVQLCVNSASRLVGMRAVSAKIVGGA